MNDGNIIQRRPAESGGLAAAAFAAILGHIFNWDGDLQRNVTILAGFIPAGITWVVDTVRARRTP